MRWIQAGIQTGDPIQHGQNRVTLRTFVAWLRIPWPGGSWALLYNRPIQVIVETSGEPMRKLPVINTTRLASVGAALYGLAAAYIFWRIAHVRK
jgi:hypothetical protein